MVARARRRRRIGKSLARHAPRHFGMAKSRRAWNSSKSFCCARHVQGCPRGTFTNRQQATACRHALSTEVLSLSSRWSAAARWSIQARQEAANRKAARGKSPREPGHLPSCSALIAWSPPPFAPPAYPAQHRERWRYLDWRACDHDAACRLQRMQRLVQLGLWVLQAVRLVRDDQAKSVGLERVDVEGGSLVRDDEQLALRVALVAEALEALTVHATRRQGPRTRVNQREWPQAELHGPAYI